MRKTFLMLLLCAPLLWFAWEECARIARVMSWSSSDPEAGTGKAAAGAEDAKKAQTDLESVAKKARSVVNLHEDLVRAIVRLDPEPSRQHGTGKLAQAILAHAQERTEGRKKLNEAVRKAQQLESEIEQARVKLAGGGAQPAGVAEKEKKNLEELLRKYQEGDLFDEALLHSEQARVAWAELGRTHPDSSLNDLYRRLDRWRPDGAGGDGPLLTDHDQKSVADHEGFIKTHESAREKIVVELVDQARKSLNLWKRGTSVASALARPKAIQLRSIVLEPIPGLAPEKQERLDQIASIVEAAENDPPERFLASVRPILQRLCADLLAQEALDDIVLVPSSDPTASPSPCARRMLKVLWKDRSPAVTLEKSPLNEFQLTWEQVESFELEDRVFTPPDDTKIPPLKGTDYSVAVHELNQAIGKIQQWSEPELTRLRRSCEPLAARLSGKRESPGGPQGGRTVIARIDRLLTIVSRHPNLFVVDAR